MEKSVYCSIGQRFKCIKVSKDKNMTDVQSVRAALLSLAQTNQILRKQIAGKEIILQKQLTHKNMRLCDIEEDEDIPDESEVTCLLVSSNEQETSIFDYESGNFAVANDGMLIEETSTQEANNELGEIIVSIIYICYSLTNFFVWCHKKMFVFKERILYLAHSTCFILCGQIFLSDREEIYCSL